MQSCITYPPYVSSYLFLLLAVWSWHFHNAMSVCLCNAIIWLTSITNHRHRSQHTGWWYADVVAVHLSLGFHMVQAVLRLPFFPYMLIETGIVVAAGCIFLKKSRDNPSGWYHSLIHILISAGVVLYTHLIHA